MNVAVEIDCELEHIYRHHHSGAWTPQETQVEGGYVKYVEGSRIQSRRFSRESCSKESVSAPVVLVRKIGRCVVFPVVHCDLACALGSAAWRGWGGAAEAFPYVSTSVPTWA